MRSAPGCWQSFGEVLAREYGHAERARLHRLAVDSYAVQHPGTDDRRARQSVALHLMSLCLVLERHATEARATALLSHVAAERAQWPLLHAPEAVAAVTVIDVLAAESRTRHLAAVQRWAEDSWARWAPHHGRVRSWLDARPS